MVPDLKVMVALRLLRIMAPPEVQMDDLPDHVRRLYMREAEELIEMVETYGADRRSRRGGER